MALNVQLNLRISSKILGTINENYGFYDPTTGVNLNRGNRTSGDLSSFSALQLANISNAVKLGVLTCTQGASALPAPTATFSSYSLYASAGVIGGGYGTGITGVAAADKYEKNF